MPIIQCACGMVMSTKADEPRHYCVRCGGIEFRPLAIATGVFRADDRRLGAREPVSEGRYVESVLPRR